MKTEEVEGSPWWQEDMTRLTDENKTLRAKVWELRRTIARLEREKGERDGNEVHEG